MELLKVTDGKDVRINVISVRVWTYFVKALDISLNIVYKRKVSS